jgi:hypothetical protein
MGTVLHENARTLTTDLTEKPRTLYTRPSEDKMSASSFDPAGTVRFDLAAGAVSLEGEGRAVLLPEGVLGVLLEAAGAAGAKALRELGARIGQAVRADVPADASPEAALQRAMGHVGRAGFGRLSMEIWGPALCLTLEGAPAGLSTEAVAAFLEGVLANIVDREVALVHLDGRYLVVAPAERTAVVSRAQSARGVPEVVAMLVEGGAS